MKHRSVTTTLGFAVGLLVAGLATAPAVIAAPAKAKVVVIASGLNNPRGLSYHNGRLYVAEAGKGGTDCPAGAVGPEGGPLCFGRTGSLISIASDGRIRTLQRGLISFSDLPGGLAAEGLMNVSVTATGGIQEVFGASVVATEAGIPHGKSLTPADDAAMRHYVGSLQALEGATTQRLADVGDADYSWTAVHRNLVPDQYPDANPNALLVVGQTTYVADAGANLLVSVRNGVVKQLAFLPNSGGSDAVPTCVAMGPDGALYLGQLAPGAAANHSKIYRYNLKTHTLRVWRSGFNVVDGCGFDNHGNFFATEFQAHGFNPGAGNPAGDVVEIRRDGKRIVLGAGSLDYPQGFATDNKGHIFVSNWSILTGTPAHPGMPTGQVVRITY